MQINMVMWMCLQKHTFSEPLANNWLSRHSLLFYPSQTDVEQKYHLKLDGSWWSNIIDCSLKFAGKTARSLSL